MIYLSVLLTIPFSLLAQQSIKVGEIQNGNLVLTISESNLMSAYNFAAQDGQIATQVELVDGAKKYLVIKGNNQDGSRVFADELILENGILMIQTDKPKHYCSGICCASCKFLKEITGEIVGCDCQLANCSEGGARCDHSMSSGVTQGFHDFSLQQFYNHLSGN
jgi:hypothetical protein